MRRGHTNRGRWRAVSPRNFGPRSMGGHQFRPHRSAAPMSLRFPPQPFAHRPQFRHQPFDTTNELNNVPSIDMNFQRLKQQHNQNFRNSRFQYHKPDYLQPNQPNNFRSGNANIPEEIPNTYQHTSGFQRAFINNFTRNKSSENFDTYKTYNVGANKYSNRSNVSEPFDKQLKSRDHVNSFGNRPHSSDYYEGNPVPSDNSKTFSCSFDDTVNIVRERLLNRKHSNSSLPSGDSQDDDYVSKPQNNNLQSHNYHNMPENPDLKKTSFKNNQELPIEANYQKIKSNIVNQLFKMDKDTIHKLMDNPHSSSKFEFAINSLITESQNSLNRHTRAAAEKSLFHNDRHALYTEDNTIYEDTFLKQMQCVLDPQDAIIFTDLKPIVMAEINKVLHLDDYRDNAYKDEYRGNEYNDYENIYERNFASNSNYDTEQESNYDKIYSESNIEENEELSNMSKGDFHEDSLDIKPKYNLDYSGDSTTDTMLETCVSPKSRNDYSREKRLSADKRRNSNNLSEERNSKNKDFVQPLPLFVGNEDPLSSDEDPFAELDNQYHIDVDPNFTKMDDDEFSDDKSKTLDCNNINETTLEEANLKNKLLTKDSFSSSNPTSILKNINHENSGKFQLKSPIVVLTKRSQIERKTESDKKVQPDESTNESLNACKRPSEQASHTKKKKKKIDLAEDIFSKPDLITVIKKEHTETLRKDNIETSRKDNIEISKKDNIEISRKDNAYKSRKDNTETPRKENKCSNNKNKETSVKKSVINLKESVPSSSNTSSHNHAHNKSDKNKLKAIDMFEDRPRKSQLHQTPRSMVTVRNIDADTKGDTKCSSKSPSKHKMLKRHVSTQVIKKVISKETQTISKHNYLRNKCTQTDIVPHEKATDIFDRMKEIDMEIQSLIQEKFKLYSSIESNDPTHSSMPNLGMSYINVNSNDTSESNIENNIEDSVIENIAALSDVDLENLALGRSPSKVSIAKTTDSKRQKSKTPKKKVKLPKLNEEKPNVVNKVVVSPIKTRRTRNRESTIKPENVKLCSVPSDLVNFIKPCSVLLIRQDITSYRDIKKLETEQHTEQPCPSNNDNNFETIPNAEEQLEENKTNEPNALSNHLHIQDDMMFISEDIVIDDDYGSSETVAVDTDKVSVAEDVVIDNSCNANVASETADKSVQCTLYDFSIDEELKKDSLCVTGNADAVLAIESVENNFVAACLDGNVYYFGADGQLLTCMKGSNLAVTCLSIVYEKCGTTVYTGSLDSRIRYYDLETGKEKGPECNVLSPIQTMDRAWGTIFVGTRTGFVLQFECKNDMLIPVSTVKFSEQSILALRAIKEGPRKVLLVAARSENVTIKDAQSGLLLRTLMGPKMTVYTLLFEEGRVYCGTSSPHIQIFDYTSGSHIGEHEGGKGAVCLRAAGGLIFASCYDGCVYVFRSGERKPMAQLRGQGVMLLSLAIVGSKIIAGYKDRSLYIWKIPESILNEMVL